MEVLVKGAATLYHNIFFNLFLKEIFVKISSFFRPFAFQKNEAFPLGIR